MKNRFSITLAITLIVLAVLSFLFESLYHLREVEQKNQLNISSLNAGRRIHSQISQDLTQAAYLSSGLAAYIKVYRSNLEETKIRELLEAVYTEYPLIRNLGLAEGTLLKYVVPSFRNADAVGIDYREIEDQWPDIEKSIQSKQSFLSGPVNLIQGGEALIYRYPIYLDTAYWGILSTVIDQNALFSQSIELDSLNISGIAIRNSETKSALFGPQRLFEDSDTYTFRVDVMNQNWEYALLPDMEYSIISSINKERWIGRILLLALFGFTFYMLKVYREKLILSERYSLLVNNASDTIWVYNISQDKYEYISPSVKSLRGLSAEEAMSKKLGSDIENKADLSITDLVDAGIKEFEKTGESIQHRFEFQMKHKNGSVVWVDMNAYLIKNDAGEYEIHGITRDITKNKEATELLKYSENQLKKVNQTRDRFFSIIAHDLKSPFNSLIGLLDILKSEYPKLTDEERITYMNLAYDSTTQGFKLVENLLTWARSQTGDIPYKPKEHSLIDLISESLQVLKVNAMNKGIRLKMEIEHDDQVFVDPYMIDTILRNLVGNALKFTPKGGRVRIKTKKYEEDWVEVIVVDNGIGIPEQILNKLFKDDKVVSTKGTDNEKGSGLGLLLCKQFIEQHGGKIWAKSDSEKGSSFHFILPSKVQS